MAEVIVMKLPDRGAVRGHGPLGRICDLLGITPVRTDLEFLHLVEEGLPLSAVQSLAQKAQEVKLPASELTAMVISRRTLRYRRKSNQPLTRDESDKLIRVARIVALAEDVFANREKAVLWLRAPKRSLGGVSPLAALATETGARLIEAMLHQIDQGITA